MKPKIEDYMIGLGLLSITAGVALHYKRKNDEAKTQQSGSKNIPVQPVREQTIIEQKALDTLGV